MPFLAFLFVLIMTGEAVAEEKPQSEPPKRYPIVLEMDTEPIVIRYGDMLQTKEVFLVNKGDRKLDMPANCQMTEAIFSLGYYTLVTTDPEFGEESLLFQLGKTNPDDWITPMFLHDGVIGFFAPPFRMPPNEKSRVGGIYLYFLPPIGTESHSFWQAVENADPEKGVQCFLEYRFSMKRCLDDSKRAIPITSSGFYGIPKKRWPPEDPEAVRLHELLDEGYVFEDELVVRCPVTILPRSPEEQALIRDWIQSGPLLAEPYPRSASNSYISPFPWLKAGFQHPFYMDGSPMLPTAGRVRIDYDPRFSNVRDPEKFIESGENFLERSKTLEPTPENLKRIEEAKAILPQAREYFAIKERDRQREAKRGDYIKFCEMLSTRTPEALRRIEEGRELGRKLLAMSEAGELPLSPTFREFIVFREKLIDFRFAETPEERQRRFDELLDWLAESQDGKFWRGTVQGTLGGMKSINRTAVKWDKTPPVFEEDIDAYLEKLKSRYEERN